MAPKIENISDDNNKLTFRITDVNVSIVNAIRRVILSDINCIVLDTVSDKNKEETSIINKNTSRLTNEIIKHRLSNIPVYLKDLTIPIEQYKVTLKKKNDSDNIIYVTTTDIVIINKTNNQPLTQSDQKNIFPPNEITKDYIDILRLLPKSSQNDNGEEIDLECNFKISSSKENSAYNVASTCSFKNTPDLVKANEIWSNIENDMKEKTLSKDEIAFQKKNWFLLDALRYYIPNSFDFILETIGVFSNKEIINLACKKLLDDLKILKLKVNGNELQITESNVTIENCFDISLLNYDYTIGNILNYYLYTDYYENEETLTFCGLKQPHPHIPQILLRIAFKEKTSIQDLNKYLINSINKSMETIELIDKNF